MNSFKNKKSAYIDFNRKQWSELANSVNFNLSDKEIEPLLGYAEITDTSDINDFYAPLARLLKFYIDSFVNNYLITQKFLGHKTHQSPFIIGITGSVSVGKSTFTRILKRVLEIYFSEFKISLINTDGFLYPLDYLKEHNLLDRKGFPESYNTIKLLDFLSDVRSGKIAKAPIYSHITYDIVPNKEVEVNKPDILIIEGLNILQTGYSNMESLNIFVSDFIDFSIYVDAKTSYLREWYISRFLNFRESSFKDKNSYFHKFTKLSETEAYNVAANIWKNINEVNLKENILPSRERANLIIEKDANHKLYRVRLRK